MNDRALLEAAARAVGRRITGWNDQHGGEPVAVLDDGSMWQPLHENYITDCMGDAFRLAVALHIPVEGMIAFVAERESDWETDPYAATRRAIVRAAAALKDTA